MTQASGSMSPTVCPRPVWLPYGRQGQTPPGWGDLRGLGSTGSNSAIFPQRRVLLPQGLPVGPALGVRNPCKKGSELSPGPSVTSSQACSQRSGHTEPHHRWGWGDLGSAVDVVRGCQASCRAEKTGGGPGQPLLGTKSCPETLRHHQF